MTIVRCMLERSEHTAVEAAVILEENVLIWQILSAICSFSGMSVRITGTLIDVMSTSWAMIASTDPAARFAKAAGELGAAGTDEVVFGGVVSIFLLKGFAATNSDRCIGGVAGEGTPTQALEPSSCCWNGERSGCELTNPLSPCLNGDPNDGEL